MPIKEYKKFVDQEINNLMGKNLSTVEIRKHLSKAYFGGKEPMTERAPIFSSPRWKQIFDFIGLEKRTSPYEIKIVSKRFPGYHNHNDGKSDSPMVQLADIVLKTSNIRARDVEGASLYDLHFRSNRPLIGIGFSEVPHKMSADILFGECVAIYIGDTIEKSKEVETIAAKKFIELKSAMDGKYIDIDDEELSYKKRMHTHEILYEILKAFVGFAMDIFAKGMEGEDEIEINNTVFFKLIANEMRDLSIPAEGLNSIRKNLPELWNIYKNLRGNDPGGLETLADLGELGF